MTDQITDHLHAHADAHIFTSLPRSGTVRAARLLAEIGDGHSRFPTPESLACLAGVAPATRQSGNPDPSDSVGPPTNNCVMRSPTSPATPATRTPGPPIWMSGPGDAGTTIPTRCASSPAPGCS
ncbi:IS110 family transposase [Rhodococcus ruber]|uniref:IS110 family transposase n=1 Tax=Rhodococcus ruber TaxID=1830 RepID=UPI001F3D05BD|nr:IS110 family transposase [Rhodococcus ruber]